MSLQMKKENLKYGGLLLFLVIFFILTPVSIVLAAKTPTTTEWTSKDFVQLFLSLGTVVITVIGASWKLNNKFNSLELQIVNLKAKIESLEKVVEALQNDDSKAELARKEIWIEINKLRERTSVTERLCDQRHPGGAGKTGEMRSIPGP